MSMRTTLSELVRDKASIVLVVAYILWEQLSKPIDTIFDLLRLLILAAVFVTTLIASYGHTEKTGNYPKVQDLIIELKDYILKEIDRLEHREPTSITPHVNPST